MKKEQAVRYLLLRSLWKYRRHTNPITYIELARSLRIVQISDNFLISWKFDDGRKETIIPVASFVLYTRSDLPGAIGSTPELENRNTNTSLDFVALVYSVSRKSLRNCDPVVPFLPNLYQNAFGYILLCFGVYCLGDFTKQAGFAAICLGLSFCFEYIYPTGKLFVPFLLFLISLAGFFHVSIICLVSYGFFQILDPNPLYRNLRILFSFLLLFFIFNKSNIFSSSYNLYFLVSISLIALLFFVMRLLNNSHFRSMPLVLPFVAIGFLFDNHFLISVFILISASVTYFLSTSFFRRLTFFK